MKAIFVSWAVLLGGVGTLCISVSNAMTTGTIDFDAIGASILVIIGSFVPAAQLGLPMFVQPKNKVDMPKLVLVMPPENVNDKKPEVKK